MNPRSDAASETTGATRSATTLAGFGLRFLLRRPGFFPIAYLSFGLTALDRTNHHRHNRSGDHRTTNGRYKPGYIHVSCLQARSARPNLHPATSLISRTTCAGPPQRPASPSRSSPGGPSPGLSRCSKIGATVEMNHGTSGWVRMMNHCGVLWVSRLLEQQHPTSLTKRPTTWGNSKSTGSPAEKSGQFVDPILAGHKRLRLG